MASSVVTPQDFVARWTASTTAKIWRIRRCRRDWIQRTLLVCGPWAGPTEIPLVKSADALASSTDIRATV